MLDKHETERESEGGREGERERMKEEGREGKTCDVQRDRVAHRGPAGN